MSMTREAGNRAPYRSGAMPGNRERPVSMLPPASARGDASESFVGRVRRSIHRRLFAASVVEFCILGPALAVLEFVITVIAFWRGDTRTGPPRKELAE